MAAIYQLGNGLTPYLNYSTSFEPTSGVDTETGEAFKPTTAKQFEGGLKYRSQDGATRLAAYFDIKKRNVVVNTPDFGKYTQNGEVRSRGVEVSWNQALTDRLDFTLGLTRLDNEVKENDNNLALVGKTPVWVAEKQASLWLDYKPLDRLDLSAGVRYVGESQMDALNTGIVPSYTVFDAAAMFRVDKTWRVGLTASNLGGKRYVGACFDANNCWMGAERNVELSLHATL